jgi:hypothetical protein
MKSRLKYSEEQKKNFLSESLIFVKRSSDNRVEFIRFSHLLISGFYIVRFLSLEDSSVCFAFPRIIIVYSAFLWIINVCSAVSGFKEPNLYIFDISRKRNPI